MSIMQENEEKAPLKIEGMRIAVQGRLLLKY
jgi:hypothetical protein